MRIPTCAFLVSLLFVSAGAFAATASNDIVGYWKTPSDKHRSSVVHIMRQNGAYRGKIVALETPRFPKDADNGHAGQIKTDLKNPDKSKRDRPIDGLVILTGLKWKADDKKWEGGTVYNPLTGKTYHAEASLSDNGQTLKAHAYVGIPLFGLTQKWKRVPGPHIFHNGSAITSTSGHSGTGKNRNKPQTTQ
jgi:uncharacterized protein (DUF2147 family)